MMFQDEHLCDGPKPVIDSTVHGFLYIWDENSTMEDWGFLLVDANNAFNDINRIGTPWKV